MRRVSRNTIAVALAAALTLASAGAGLPADRAAAGHGLSIVVRPGWELTHRRFTPCSDPVERFSLIRGDQVLTVEERLDPVRAELRPRPARFAVRGAPSQLECCAIEGRRGWMIQFGEGGRAFYAYLYPGRGPVEPLLDALDTLRVG
jgi:hypothetical protein